MQTANANIYIVLQRNADRENTHTIQKKYGRSLARKRNKLVFAVAYGIFLALLLKLIF